ERIGERAPRPVQQRLGALPRRVRVARELFEALAVAVAREQAGLVTRRQRAHDGADEPPRLASFEDALGDLFVLDAAQGLRDLLVGVEQQIRERYGPRPHAPAAAEDQLARDAADPRPRGRLAAKAARRAHRLQERLLDDLL